MNVSKIKGLKYPDEYFIKYFFKSGFHDGKKKKFIEFGSANGNNLMLAYQYGHEVIGIDFDETSTQYAKDNFAKLNLENSYQFYADDMRNYIQNNKNINADVFLLPNIVNYITTDDLVKFLKVTVENNIIKSGADFFMRTRTIKDFRYGIGKEVEYNTYKIPDDYDITGEAGCINRFYQESEMIDILKSELNLREYKIFHLDCQNLQNGVTLLNSDIVIWGKIL